MKPIESIALLLPFMMLAASQVSAQMIDPAIDPPNQPFNYVAFPTDQMGMLYNSNGTEITPEGFLFTGYTELLFFTGNPPEPIYQRIRTLYKGYLPIYKYDVERKGLSYAFTTFANTLTHDPSSNLVNFIRVVITNHSDQPRHDTFSLALRYINADGKHRFRRPRKMAYPGAKWQPGVPFNPNWGYSFSENGIYRNDSLMVLFSGELPATRVRLKQVPAPRGRTPLPSQPAGWLHYDFMLAPGDSLTLDFKMPYHPLPKGHADIQALNQLEWEKSFQGSVNFWENLLAQGMQIRLPEDKVVNTFKTSLIYNLMSLDKIGEDFIQTVNLFQYHAFWLRDASFIVQAYELTGYADFARKCLDFFLHWQQEDGNFVSQGGQFDGWGQALWAFGLHVQMTQDLAFARKVFPAVKKAVLWLQQARAADEFRLMPKTRPGDNERITGHVTGHNFWALLGLRQAIALANRLNETEAAKQFQQEYDDFYAALMKRLEEITAMSGGYIPPGLDKLGGYDWGNLLGVWPTEVLSPWDAKVSATQSRARQAFREGLMTYANQRYIHNYLTTNLTETSLIRGEQKTVLQDLYALLVHTTSTHAGFETSVLPWATRDVRGNLTPHGWFAARYRVLLRDMLVREQGQDLHLLSAISPRWLQPGIPIGVENAPTRFGTIGFQLTPDATGVALNINAEFGHAPQAIVVHIPYFVILRSVTLEGQTFTLKENGGLNHPSFPRIGTDRVILAPNTQSVHLNWRYRSRPDELSYEFYVEKFKQEFARKYRKYLQERGVMEE